MMKILSRLTLYLQEAAVALKNTLIHDSTRASELSDIILE